MRNLNLTCFFFCCVLFAQENAIDQLYSKLKTTEADSEARYQLLDTLAILTENADFHPYYEEVATECVRLGLKQKKYERTAYQTISVLYFYNNIDGNPEKGIPFADAILKYKDSIPSYFKRAMLFMNRGDAYYFTNQNDQAIENYNQAEYYFGSGEEKFERFVAMVRSYRAAALAKKGEFVKATTDLQKAIVHLETTTDTFNMVSSRNELSILFSNYRFYEKAEAQRQEILKLKYSNDAQLASIYLKSANDAYEQNKIADFEKNILKALEYAQKTDRRKFTEPSVLLTIAEKYYELNRKELAEKYEADFMALYNPDTDFIKSDYRLLQITKAMINNQFEEAKVLLEAHLVDAKQTNNAKSIYKTEAKLATVYASMGKFEKAFKHQTKASHLKDSIESDIKLKSLSYYQTEFETEKKDQLIASTTSKLSLLALESKLKIRLLIIVIIVGFVLVVGFYVVKKRQEIQKEQEIQLKFTQELIKSQDKERAHISSNLHDSLGQTLVILKKQIKKSNQESLIETVDFAIDELRTISRNLYPPILQKLGLGYTLEQLSKQIFDSTAIHFNLTIDKIEPYFSQDEVLNVYRFIQEALNNTLKHAEATEINIKLLKETKQIRIQIQDNGKGFDVSNKKTQNKSLGLQTLKHRVESLQGKLKIESSNKGTQIIGIIPIKEK